MEKTIQKSGIEIIAQERQRHESKGYTAEHDEMESAFQLSTAAGMFIAEAQNKEFKDHSHYDDKGNVARFQIREVETRKWNEYWPWNDHDGREKADIITCLAKAGALCAAEIDRLLKMGEGEKSGHIIEVGDYIKGYWRSPNGNEYQTEGVVNKYPAGLFVDAPNNAGTTSLSMFSRIIEIITKNK